MRRYAILAASLFCFVLGFIAGRPTQTHDEMTAEIARLKEIANRSAEDSSPQAARVQSASISSPAVAGRVVDSDEMGASRAQARGEREGYRLKFGDAASRKELEEQIKESTQQYLKDHVGVYEQTLAAYGVPIERREQLIDHIAKIKAASLEVEAITQQALLAQLDFRRGLAQALTPEQYDRFVSGEEERKAAAEFQRVALLASEANLQLEPEDSIVAQFVLRKVGAYTATPPGGPFDPLPTVFLGDEDQGVAYSRHKAQEASKTLELVSNEAQAAGASDRLRELLQLHFKREIDKHEKTAANIRRIQQFERETGSTFMPVLESPQ